MEVIQQCLVQWFGSIENFEKSVQTNAFRSQRRLEDVTSMGGGEMGPMGGICMQPSAFSTGFKEIFSKEFKRDVLRVAELENTTVESMLRDSS